MGTAPTSALGFVIALITMNKSYVQWQEAKAWAEAHPGHTTAIVTPRGTFTLVFEAKRGDPRGTAPDPEAP